MLGSLSQFGKEIGRELSRAWETLSDGWRELLTRSGEALTRFVRKDEATGADVPALRDFPNWGLLAGELYDQDDALVLRLELPGVDRKDVELAIEGNMLIVRGEKRHEAERVSGAWYIRERAYGRFERIVPLPAPVDVERAEATCRDGVLAVRLPKRPDSSRRRIDVL